MGVMACTRFRLQGRKVHNEESESSLYRMQHAYWSSSSSLPNIIKIPLRYILLQTSNEINGKNYWMETNILTQQQKLSQKRAITQPKFGG